MTSFFNMLLQLLLSMHISLEMSVANQLDVCKQALKGSEFRGPCADLNKWQKRPCTISTNGIDYSEFESAKLHYMYLPPGEARDRTYICAPMVDTLEKSECLVSSDTSNNQLAWTWSEWSSAGGITKIRRIVLTDNASNFECPYGEALAETMDITWAIDDWGELYVDGELIGTTTRWDSIQTHTIRADARVIAFTTYSNFGGRGPSAVLTNGIKTHTSFDWVCSKKYMENWNQVDLDDRQWLKAAHDVRSAFYSDPQVYSLRCSSGGGENPEYLRLKLW